MTAKRKTGTPKPTPAPRRTVAQQQQRAAETAPKVETTKEAGTAVCGATTNRDGQLLVCESKPHPPLVWHRRGDRRWRTSSGDDAA